MGRFPRRDESGFTLVEILVAAAILMIGLVAVMQWFPMGTQGMEAGRRQSTAVFLAEQKLEQIKAFGLSTGAGQGFAAVPICNPCNAAAPFNQENFGAVAGYPEFSRTVIVTLDPASAPGNTRKLVRVQVAYRRVTTQGTFTGGQQAEVMTLIAQH